MAKSTIKVRVSDTEKTKKVRVPDATTGTIKVKVPTPVVIEFT